MNNLWMFWAILKPDRGLINLVFDQISMISIVSTQNTALLSLQNQFKTYLQMKVKLLNSYIRITTKLGYNRQRCALFSKSTSGFHVFFWFLKNTQLFVYHGANYVSTCKLWSKCQSC